MNDRLAPSVSQNLAKPIVGSDGALAQVFALAGGRAVLMTQPARDKSSGNEDCAALIPCGEHAGVLVVADGLGGLPAGQAASRQVVTALTKSISRAVRGDQGLRGAILDALESANREIIDSGNGNASTVAVVEVDGRIARPYHVGDSQIMITGQRGRLKLQTVAHSPTGYAVEAGLMDETEALAHDERHYVANVVGAKDMRIEVGARLTLADFDTVIVASDGLWDNLYAEEISDRVRTGNLGGCATDLMAAAQHRIDQPAADSPSHVDDVTFALYRPDR